MSTVRNCTTCEEAISPARLEAVPNARLCRSCKENEESNTPRQETPVAYYTLNNLSLIRGATKVWTMKSNFDVSFQDEDDEL
jgi:hypothetical protein